MRCKHLADETRTRFTRRTFQLLSIREWFLWCVFSDNFVRMYFCVENWWNKKNWNMIEHWFPRGHGLFASIACIGEAFVLAFRINTSCCQYVVFHQTRNYCKFLYFVVWTKLTNSNELPCYFHSHSQSIPYNQFYSK